MEAPRKPVGVWVRVSTDLQAKGDSPAIQEQRTREFAQAKGWEVATLYRLEGVSGAISLEHPEARRMVKDAETGRIQALIATRFARVARDGVNFRLLHRKLKSLGVELISLDENIDTSTPAGELMIGLMADLAELERKETSSRIRASVKPRAKAGKSLGGEAPFGYEWKDGKLELHPIEAPIRRLVHELYLEHRKKKTVAQKLNERGYKTRRGKAWSDSTVEWLLRDPSAKGWHRKNYIQSNGPGQKWSFKAQEEVVLHSIPAIVTEEVWDKAFAVLTQQSGQRQRPTKQVRQLFAGLIACICGRKMYVKSGTAKYTCYGCNNKVTAWAVEQAFVKRLVNYTINPAELAASLEASDEKLAEKAELLRSCQAKKRQLEREMKSALSLHEQGKLDGTAFGKLTAPIQQQLAQLEEEIPRVAADIEDRQKALPKADEVLAQGKTLADAWKQLDFEGQRSLVEALLISATVDKENRLHVEMAHLTPLG